LGVEQHTERELIARAKSGDERAFAELVVEHQTLAFRTAYLITRSASEAEDAAQEGFIRAYLALERFRPEAPFRPWLLQIVANAAKNRVRSGSRQLAVALKLETREVAFGSSPEASVVSTSERAALAAALETLRADEQLIIGCRFLLDLSEQDTAEIVGCPVGTVKSRLARALEKMRATIGSPDG
jgi:RNA polymerase sigma factor (sigma-70 family)